MTREEAVKLCQFVAEACPQQRFSEYTADVWAEIFPASFDLGDCLRAVVAVKQRQAFVDPSDIIAEVKAIRRSRLEHVVIPAPSHELTGEPGKYKAELHRQIVAIASAKDVNEVLGICDRSALRAIEGGGK